MSIWILSTHSEYAKKKKGVLKVDCFKFLLLSLGNKIKPWQGQQAVIDLSIIIREKFNQRRHNLIENVKHIFSKEFSKFLKWIFIWNKI